MVSITFIASFFLKLQKSSCFLVFIIIYETFGEFEALASQWQIELFSQKGTFIMKSSLQCWDNCHTNIQMPSPGCTSHRCPRSCFTSKTHVHCFFFASLTPFPSEINSSEIIVCSVFSELVGSWFLIVHFPVSPHHPQGGSSWPSFGAKGKVLFLGKRMKKKEQVQGKVLEAFLSLAKPFLVFSGIVRQWFVVFQTTKFVVVC